MKRLFIRLFATLLLSGLINSLCFAQEPSYQVFTEKTKPYVISIGEPGQSKGLIIELLEAALKKQGIAIAAIRADAPWAQTQVLAKDTENSLIAPLARAPMREANFKWIEPLVDDHIVAYVREGEVPSGFAALKSYSQIGVRGGSATDSRMKELNIKTLPSINENENFNHLLNGDVPVILVLDYVANAEIKNFASKASTLKKSQSLLSVPLWVATSPKTSRESIENIRKAIKSFKSSPEYSAILKQY